MIKHKFRMATGAANGTITATDWNMMHASVHALDAQVEAMKEKPTGAGALFAAGLVVAGSEKIRVSRRRLFSFGLLK